MELRIKVVVLVVLSVVEYFLSALVDDSIGVRAAT